MASSMLKSRLCHAFTTYYHRAKYRKWSCTRISNVLVSPANPAVERAEPPYRAVLPLTLATFGGAIFR